MRGWPFFRVSVAGSSMVPTLLPGHRLLVSRWSPWDVGSIVALPDPRLPERMLVKRVRSRGGDGVEVRGDNEDASTDSRTFGPVPPSWIAGRVVYRYLPADLAGRVR